MKSGGNGSTGVVDERSEETRLVRLRKSPTIKVVQQKKKYQLSEKWRRFLFRNTAKKNTK